MADVTLILSAGLIVLFEGESKLLLRGIDLQSRLLLDIELSLFKLFLKLRNGALVGLFLLFEGLPLLAEVCTVLFKNRYLLLQLTLNLEKLSKLLRRHQVDGIFVSALNFLLATCLPDGLGEFSLSSH